MDAARYAPWAVVTGAAQGIGAAFADALASVGLSLLLIDREPELLAAKAGKLRATGATVVESALDLGAAGAADTLVEAVADIDVGLFVSNAAVSVVGRFTDQSLHSKLAQLEVNCRVPLVVIDHLLPRLVARGSGGIILLSSGSALRGSPLVAGYAATKAWNLLLAESLWDEVRGDGVDVLAVLPGTTRTPGWLRDDPQPSLSTASVMEPADVVGEALAALGRQPSIVPGQANRDAEAFMAGLERAEAVAIVGQVMRDTYPGRA
ncbi:MAG: SDR family NAD(P)-dependent oxidoreductase [Acidimicrobiales bacterium]